MVGQYFKSRGNDLQIFKKVDPVVTSEFCVHWGKHSKTATF